jgi:elongation factor P
MPIVLNYNEIKPKKYIIFEGEPYEVLSSHVFRKQQRKPVNQTKLKNIITGRVVEYSFHQNDKVGEAELEHKKIKYLYLNPKKEEFWFSEENNPKERFTLEQEKIGQAAKFLKENMLVDAMLFRDKIIGVKLPIKMELKVVEAPPSLRGNTAQGGTKQITLETGAVINAPLFINQGDTVVINTETNEYAERV